MDYQEEEEKIVNISNNSIPASQSGELNAREQSEINHPSGFQNSSQQDQDLFNNSIDPKKDSRIFNHLNKIIFLKI